MTMSSKIYDKDFLIVCLQTNYFELLKLHFKNMFSIAEVSQGDKIRESSTNSTISTHLMVSFILLF